MTRLMIHWHLVHGADGKTHLGMAWESTRTCIMLAIHVQSQPV